MINNRFVLIALAMAGGAAAAQAIGRYTRHQERRQLKQDVRKWEDEGGNLAPSEAPAVAPPAVTPTPGSSQ